ncbi:MAG: hypothetical protein HYY93_02255 [Planctomycetes bacterium]|nr:hypothetical protein [Planctomycetota bacterium]
MSLRRPVAFGLLAALLLLGGAPLRAGDEKKPIIDQMDEVRRRVADLQVKMERIRKKIAESQQFYADKLGTAKEMLKERLVEKKIEEVLEAIRQDKFGIAAEKVEVVSKDIDEILNFLENRKGNEQMKALLEKIRRAMAELKQLQKEEQEIRDDTARLQRDRDAEIAAMKGALEEAERLQRELKEENDRNRPSEQAAKMADLEQKLGDLARQQESLASETGQAQSSDLQKLNEVASALKKAIRRQQESLDENKAIQTSEEGVKVALQKVNNLLAEQQAATEKTGQAIADPQSQKPEALGKSQDLIRRNTDDLGDELSRLPLPEGLKDLADAREAVNKAAARMEDAASDLKEGSVTPARETQEKAVAQLDGARKSLEALRDKLAAGREKIYGAMAKGQEEARSVTDQVAAQAREASSQASAAPVSEALQKAEASLGKASSAQQQAARDLQSKNGPAAQKGQESALSSMKEAQQNLERLADQVAQKEKPRLEALAEKQAELQKEAGKASDQLREEAKSGTAPSQQEAREGMKQAAEKSGAAGAIMGMAQQSLGKNAPGQAQKEQQAAANLLKEAQERVKKLREQLAKDAAGESERTRKLAQRQKELEEQTSKLADKMRQTATEQAQKDPSLSQGAQQAGQKTQQAGDQMSKAQQNLQNERKPIASRNQEEALQALAEAKKALEELKKRGMTEEEKRRLERLSARQRETEQKTKDLQKQVEEMDQKKAAQSLDSAGKNMSSAESNMQQGQPQQAQQDEEQAQKDLEEAMKELEEAERQYANMQQEEALQRLEADMGELLKKQKSIDERTIVLEGARLSSPDQRFTREKLAELKTLAGDQKKLAEEAREVKKKVESEAAEVFAWTLGSAADDMDFVATLLGEQRRTDESTQEVQADIERKLRELQEAFRNERMRRSKKGGQQGGGGGGQQPLVPAIAELRLLRQMEINVKRKTEEFAKGSIEPDAKELDEIQRTILRRLSHEQGTIAELTQKLADRLQQRHQPPPEKGVEPGEGGEGGGGK